MKKIKAQIDEPLAAHTIAKRMSKHPREGMLRHDLFALWRATRKWIHAVIWFIADIPFCICWTIACWRDNDRMTAEPKDIPQERND